MNGNLLSRILAKWEAPLILSIWAFAFLCMLDRSQYKAFLRPEFGFLVTLGMFATLAMLLSFAFEEENECHAHEHATAVFSKLFRVGIMTVPILLMFSALGSNLNSDAYKKRALAPVAQISRTDDGPVLVPATPNAVSSNVGTPQVQSTGPSFLEIVFDPKAFDGAQVAVEGMASHDPEITKEFGSDAFLVFRFAITCCAADARPVAVVVKAPGMSFKENAWLRASGKVQARKLGDKSVIAILKDAECKKTAVPDEPYLYP